MYMHIYKGRANTKAQPIIICIIMIIITIIIHSIITTIHLLLYVYMYTYTDMQTYIFILHRRNGPGFGDELFFASIPDRFPESNFL